MRILLIFILLGVVGYLGWDKYHPERYFLNHSVSSLTQVTPQPPVLKDSQSPEEIVSVVINQPIVNADDLAVVYHKFPQITASMLESKTIHLTGAIEHLEIADLDHETAEIKLKTPLFSNIYIDDNLKLLPGVTNTQWKRIGDSLVLSDQSGSMLPLSQNLFTIGEMFASSVPLRLHKCTALT